MNQNNVMPLASATEMLDAGVELESVEFFGLSATVSEDWDGPSDETFSVIPEMGLKYRRSDDEFGARLFVKVDLGYGVASVDVSATYRFPQQVSILDDAANEFANKVAVMALLPYARQALSDLTQRVFGEPIVLPILRQGQLRFDVDQS